MPKSHLVPSTHQSTTSDAAVTDFSVCEEDLAIYAALSGKRPVIEVIEDEDYILRGYFLPEAAHGLRKLLDRLHFDRLHKRRRMAVWLRHVSHSARHHLDQARMRMAG